MIFALACNFVTTNSRRRMKGILCPFQRRSTISALKSENERRLMGEKLDPTKDIGYLAISNVHGDTHTSPGCLWFKWINEMRSRETLEAKLFSFLHHRPPALRWRRREDTFRIGISPTGPSGNIYYTYVYTLYVQICTYVYTYPIYVSIYV